MALYFHGQVGSFGEAELKQIRNEHKGPTRKGRRIWCVSSNLGKIEQEEKGEKIQETNFEMCNKIVFVNPCDYQQDLLWSVKCTRKKVECQPGSLGHRTVATNVKKEPNKKGG